MSKKPTPEDFSLTEARLGQVALECTRRNQNETNKEEDTSGIGGYIFTGILGAIIGMSCIGVPVGVIVGAGEAGAYVGMIIGVIIALSINNSGNEKTKQKQDSEMKELVQKIGEPVTTDEIINAAKYESACVNWQYQQKSTWDIMDGSEFNRKVCDLLNNHNWELVVAGNCDEIGYDLVGKNPDGITYFIQCKISKEPSGVQPIRELAGIVLAEEEDTNGMVVCINGFTNDAEEFALKSNIKLQTMKDIVNLVETV